MEELFFCVGLISDVTEVVNLPLHNFNICSQFLCFFYRAKQLAVKTSSEMISVALNSLHPL